MTFIAKTVPLARIGAIQFGLFDPNFIENYSVCEISEGVAFESDGIHPVQNGLNDIRMGPSVFNGKTAINCLTDNLGNDNCPGYFGHLNLARPVYHVNFLKTVIHVLTCVNHENSTLILDQSAQQHFSSENPPEKGEKRLKKILKLTRTIKKSKVTNTFLPTYKLNITETEGIQILMKFHGLKTAKDTDSNKTAMVSLELLPLATLEILRKISNEDIVFLGFDPIMSRPEWLIITVLPIPPPAVRPAIIHDVSSRSEDDLSIVLNDIIRENNDIRRLDKTGAGDDVMRAVASRMQTRIAGYFDNTLPNLERVKHGEKPIKSLSERLKGKHGRIRGNLMGKRVDFSARTVITGDANIELDELGVPESICRNLTYPEIVIKNNSKKLSTLVNAQKIKRLIRDVGSEIRSYIKITGNFILKLGDTLERHLSNGDIVLLNRQPSLHKMSMMGHRVKTLPYSTFRLNLSVTTPYNADFDGDEMNMHVPQTHDSRVEIRNLTMVPLNIVSAQRNKPIISIVQDTLLGSSLITRRDTFIDKKNFMSICMCLENWNGSIPVPALVYPSLLWTGKQVFTLFLPIIDLRGKSEGFIVCDHSNFSINDTQVLIINGQLVTGILCKKTLGSCAGGLIHVTWIEKGPQNCSLLINNIQFSVTEWLLQNGMSIGIGDTVADISTLDKIKDAISAQKEEVEKNVRQYQSREMQATPGLSLIETFEKVINEVLNKARENAGKAAQLSLKYDNNMKRLTQAGSKGNNNNISQMIACVAQQNVEGCRIHFDFCHRSLPHFVKGDYGPESKGFVENSYLTGLEPQELYFHAMGGREGLIDTAIKTADSGYIQRKLVKALEDLMVRYDGTVRSVNEEIIQFLYGEDGLDGSRIEAQYIEQIRMSVHELQYNYQHAKSKTHDSYSNKSITTHENDILEREYVSILATLRMFRKKFINPQKPNDPHTLPVHMTRLIEECRKKFSSKKGREKEIKPILVAKKVAAFVNHLLALDFGSVKLQSTRKFISLIKLTLASKRVLNEYRLTLESLDWLFDKILERFHLALINPGEMIGTVAAQSLGEPTTQMTLNTFHSAGIGTQNVTLGVPRMKELLNVTKNIKTPSSTIFVQKEVPISHSRTKKIASAIEFTVLGKLLKNIQIWYDPDLKITILKEDQFLLHLYSLELREDTCISFAPWIIRIELDTVMSIDKEIFTKDVAEKLEENLSGLVRILYSPMNSNLPIIRMRFIYGGDNSNNMAYLLDYFKYAKLCSTFYLKGIKKIYRAMISQTKKPLLFDCQITDPTEAVAKFPDWPELDYTNESMVIYTDGSNMLEIMAIDVDINHEEVYSNDVVDVIQTLGIEACRMVLFEELKRVVEFDGSGVNYRHHAILVETMTFRGKITPINRHGISRNVNSKPLIMCSFEEPNDTLTKAAIFAEKEILTGVSDNILVGQLPTIGSACFSLLIDELNLSGITENTLNAYRSKQKTHHRHNYETNIAYSPTSPAYSPTSPAYSPVSLLLVFVKPDSS
jgi:DNA-directed RNA polymerase II subunit RPB1